MFCFELSRDGIRRAGRGASAPIVVILSALALCPLPGRAAQVTLARGGRPLATIVTPDAPAIPIARAASDLQSYIGKLCGVILPIHDDGKAVKGTGLYIGACEPAATADLPSAGLNPETYAVHQHDGNIFFEGRYPSPTAFAVYSFLEDQLGIRWFAPGDDWEYVPAHRRGELTVDVKDVVSVPDTSPRIWSGHEWTPAWKAWDLRNKVVVSEVVPRRNFQNMMWKVFPPSKYAKTHPEYYPLINGKRWIPKSDTEADWRPCESNPEVQHIIVEYIRQYFRDHPEADSFSLGMDDISHLCGCPNCRAMDAHLDDYEHHRFSDRHYKLVDIIADQIEQSNPDKYIGTLIYSVARVPPTTVGKLDENVFGYITQESAQWYKPQVKAADEALTREWRSRVTHLSRYDYLGLGTFTPRVYPHHLAEEIKFDKSLGFEGMYTEMYTFLPNTAPMTWAFSKLEWNSSQDIDALLHEFYAKMFGRAAQPMARYYQLLEDSWNQPRPGHDGWVHRNLIAQVTSISPQAVRQGMRLLDEALSNADNAEVRKRIEVVRAGLQYASYAILPYGLSQELTAQPVTSPAQAEATLGKIEEMEFLRRQRASFWPAAMQRRDLLGDSLRGLSSLTSMGANGYLTIGNVGTAEFGEPVGLTKLLTYYQQSQPARIAEICRQIEARLPPGQSRDMVHAWRWMQQDKPANLLVNGNFEQNVVNVSIPAILAPETTKFAGWSTWHRSGTAAFSLVAGAGTNHSVAARIAPHGDMGALLQSVKVEPGQKYLCTAWVRGSGFGGATPGEMSVRFLDASAKWLPAGTPGATIEVPISASSDWQPLMSLVTVPPGTGYLDLIFSAPGQGAEESTSSTATLDIDDAAVSRIPDQP